MHYLSFFVVCCCFLIPDVAAFSVEIPTTTTSNRPPPQQQQQQQEHSPIIEVPRMSVNEFTTYWRKLHHDRYHQRQKSDDKQNNDHPLLTPILVTGALSSPQCEFICSQFIETAQKNNTTAIFVELQRRRRMKSKGRKLIKSKGRRRSSSRKQQQSDTATSTKSEQQLLVSTYNVSLLQAIDTIMTKSNHNDAFWCFQEGLLEDHHAVFQPIYKIVQ